MKNREIQKVVWDLVPTADPDAVVLNDQVAPQYQGKIYLARNIVNASTGSGMDTLWKIVKELLPVVDDPTGFTTTVKEIIRTDRNECPCCHSELEAIVRVNPQGVWCSGWNEVEGLYKVRILPGGQDCEVTVDKLSGTVIHKSRTAFLPRKSYP